MHGVYLLFLSLVFIICTLVLGSAHISELFLRIPFEVIVFLIYTTGYWIPSLILLIVDNLFNHVNRQYLKRVFVTIGLIITIMTALIPMQIYIKILLPILIVIVAFLVVVLFDVLKAYFRNREASLLLLVAVALLIDTGLFEILYQLDAVNTPSQGLLSILILYILVSFGYILAKRVSNSYKQEIMLAHRLQESLENVKKPLRNELRAKYPF